METGWEVAKLLWCTCCYCLCVVAQLFCTMLQFVWSKNFKNYYLALEFPARMYLLVKLLRKHKHKFTFDKQVRACNSGYIHSSNMDNSLETRITDQDCQCNMWYHVWCNGSMSTVGKKGKGRSSRRRYYIYYYLFFIYTCASLFSSNYVIVDRNRHVYTWTSC